MTDPVRVSNPDAESLGFLPNGEEIMAVYKDARPPSVIVFDGLPPTWSSFGNKTSWGNNDFIDDSPTKVDKEQRDQEIKTVKNKIDVKLQDNANKIADTKQKLTKATDNKTLAEKKLRESRAKGADKSETLALEFKVALADLNEYSLKTEIAGYEAFKLHGEAQKISADADSLRIGSREANKLLNEADKKEQEAKNADTIATQMKNEYDKRKTAFDKFISDNSATGGAKLVALEMQQNQLLDKQAQDDKLIKVATQNLSNANNALNNSKQQLKNAEKNLNDKRNTPDGKTVTSPASNPIKTSTKHQIFVKDPMFSGRIDVTTEAEINNQKNLDYLLSHSGLDYKRNILNDRNPVVTDDVEGDTAIYNAEVAEWDKLRNRLLIARDQITSAQNLVNSAKQDVQQKTQAQVKAQNELNTATSNKNNTQNNLKDINQKINNEKQNQQDLQQIKDAVKISADFFKELYGKYGDNQAKIAQELVEASKGAQLRSVNDAIKSFGTFKGNFDKIYSESELKAISYRLESVNRGELAKNLGTFSKAFGLTSRIIDTYDTVMELKKAIDTDNWRPFFVKVESIFAGAGAGMLTAWAFSIIISTPLGAIGFALIMAAVSALVNESLMEKLNKAIGI